MAGCRGAVIQGATRDVPLILDLGFPVFCTGRTPCDSLGRWFFDGFDLEVDVHGVRIRPGDSILGDADGVLCIPREIVAEVIEKGEAMKAREDRVRADILSGMPLAQVVAKHGSL